MLVPLGESAFVKDILLKLDGFYGNVSSPGADSCTGLSF